MAHYNPSGISQLVKDIDAWTNYDAAALSAHYGMPVTMLRPFTNMLKSNPANGPKACIFNNDGEILNSVYAINGLALLYAICRMLDINANNDALGRGSQARILQIRIVEHLMRRVADDQ